MKKSLILSLILIFFVSCAKTEELVKERIEQATPLQEIPKEAIVEIRSSGYYPNTVTIAKGGTVRWINKDSKEHTVTNPEKKFNSQRIDPGFSWSYTFEKEGYYNYGCIYHPEMKGKVVVK